MIIAGDNTDFEQIQKSQHLSWLLYSVNNFYYLEISTAWRTRESNYVTDVLYTSYVRN